MIEDANMKPLELQPEKQPCEFCGCDDDSVEFQCDQFAAEINEDYTEHWICANCYHEKATDI